jgi:hypothetical protein
MRRKIGKKPLTERQLETYAAFVDYMSWCGFKESDSPNTYEEARDLYRSMSDDVAIIFRDRWNEKSDEKALEKLAQNL